MKISVIVPTINRAEVLKIICIPSLVIQTFSDFELIVWDASTNNDSQAVVEEFIVKYPNLDIKYFHAPRKGLASQRNDAVRVASGDIILFIDDDVSLDPKFLEELGKIYANDKEHIIGGAQGIILTPNSAKNTLKSVLNLLIWVYSFLFMLPRESKYQKVLISGRYTSFSPSSIQESYNNDVVIDFNLEWLSGCCMSYRREIFDKYQLKFDERFEKFGGYAYMEDGDFSYRVFKKLGFKLAMIKTARCTHYHVPGGRGNKRSRYASMVYNHYLFWRKNIGLSLISVIAFIWSQFGILNFALVDSLFRLNFEPLIGILMGWKEIVKEVKECL